MKDKTIEESDVDGIVQLLNSKDPESVSLGFSILENCNMARSLPWLIIIYKLMNHDVRRDVMSNPDCVEFWKYLSEILKIQHSHKVFTSQHCYDAILKHVKNKEVIQYVEKTFAANLRLLLISWGYSFLSDYNLTITKK